MNRCGKTSAVLIGMVALAGHLAEADGLPRRDRLVVSLTADSGVMTAETNAATPGQLVARWLDRSPVGGQNDAAQPLPHRQPRLRRSGSPYHRMAIDFEGRAFLSLGDLSALFPEAATVIAACWIPDRSGWCLYETARNDSWWREGGYDGYIGTFRQTRAHRMPPGMNMDGYHVFAVVSSPERYAFFADGDLKGENPPQYHAGDEHLIGATFWSDYARFFPGLVFEVLVYNVALTDEERQEAEAYLRQRWFTARGGASRMAAP